MALTPENLHAMGILLSLFLLMTLKHLSKRQNTAGMQSSDEVVPLSAPYLLQTVKLPTYKDLMASSVGDYNPLWVTPAKQRSR
ncbi:hypothetical protein EVAR_12055_1 [Eumeta japonica]|uniref:Uncharacterized protein n=1 Tax=Eumeta variegata TaxID=151549 RepID=A0A4C1U647_EUMVA|nr:hypothetical protein EVAR_12055_1 [Eumeta japonica]